MRKLILGGLTAAILTIGAPVALANKAPHEGHGGPKCPNPAGKTPPACGQFTPPEPPVQAPPCEGADIVLLDPASPLVCVFIPQG